MKIKNTSTKVISIGTVALLPDDETLIKNEVASTPAVKALVEKGFLTFVESKPEKAEEKKPEVEETAETKAEVETKAENTEAPAAVTEPPVAMTKTVGKKNTAAKK